MPEAQLEDSGSGLAPASDGWFVVNVRDAQWLTSENGEKRPSGSECSFESAKSEFPQLGIRLHVLEPGEPNGLYHAESEQEAFLVLSGECTLLVEGEERLLRQWDFFHSPARTEHIFVGAGEAPVRDLHGRSPRGELERRLPGVRASSEPRRKRRNRDDRPEPGVHRIRAVPPRAPVVLGPPSVGVNQPSAAEAGLARLGRNGPRATPA